MESTTSLNDLPPLKRLRLMQQQQQQQQKQHHHHHYQSSSPLPTKKRKESRTQSPPSPTSCNYTLPAKKRVWAPQPPNDAVPIFDLNASPSPSPSQEEEEDGILCCVCQSTDGDPGDPIVFCDGCDLMVHASCYGNPLSNSIPDGDWFCQCCRFGPNAAVTACSLCPAREGALKKCTREGAWAHVVCALFVPEVFFRDPEGREGIDCSMVPDKRWAQTCYVCGLTQGCGLVCSEPKCGRAFHVTCALKEDLWMDYREGKKGTTVVAGFCKTHTQIWDKQQQSGKYKIVAVEDEK